MNIFKILSTGDGRLQEPNLSAFMAYLLDPTGDHGLGSKFLESFITPLVFEFSGIYKELISDNKKIKNKKIKDLSAPSNFYVEIIPEESVEIDKRRRDIDIVIEVYKKDKEGNVGNDPVYIIAVENKIKNGAVTVEQLIDEISGLIDSDVYPDNIPTGFIFLTKNRSDKSKKSFEGLKEDLKKNSYSDRVKPAHLIWEKDDKEPSKSVFLILSTLFNQESLGLIEPMHEYTKHTLKALNSFIDSDFKSYIEEKQEGEKWKKRLMKNDFKTIYSKLNWSDKSKKLLMEIHDDIIKTYLDKIEFQGSFSNNGRISYFIMSENKFVWIEKRENNLRIFLFTEEGKVPKGYTLFRSGVRTYPVKIIYCDIDDVNQYQNYVKKNIEQSFNLFKH